jgi:hypothetical protein
MSAAKIYFRDISVKSKLGSMPVTKWLNSYAKKAKLSQMPSLPNLIS